jgi:hypothetical protein
MKIKLFFVFIMGLFLISSVLGAEYQLKRAVELSVGDVIVASDGSEIVVEKIDFVGKEFKKETSDSLMDVFWREISGGKVTGMVVSGGESNLGLSLGEMGIGVKMVGGIVEENDIEKMLQPRVEEKKSFWDKLMFWRNS